MNWADALFNGQVLQGSRVKGHGFPAATRDLLYDTSKEEDLEAMPWRRLVDLLFSGDEDIIAKLRVRKRLEIARDYQVKEPIIGSIFQGKRKEGLHGRLKIFFVVVASNAKRSQEN
jgi:hypothetical protein